jgi:hypothetical protein
MGEKCIDFTFGHFRRMAHIMEKNIPPRPMAIRLLRPAAVMTGTQGFPELV